MLKKKPESKLPMSDVYIFVSLKPCSEREYVITSVQIKKINGVYSMVNQIVISPVLGDGYVCTFLLGVNLSYKFINIIFNIIYLVVGP